MYYTAKGRCFHNAILPVGTRCVHVVPSADCPTELPTLAIILMCSITHHCCTLQIMLHAVFDDSAKDSSEGGWRAHVANLNLSVSVCCRSSELSTSRSKPENNSQNSI